MASVGSSTRLGFRWADRQFRFLGGGWLVVGASLLLVACSGGRLGRGVVEETVGRGTHRDISRSVVEIFSQFGYPMDDVRDSRHHLYFSTSWQRREPLEDEAVLGVGECRTRLIVRARRGGGDLYAVRLRVENEGIRGGAAGDWAPLAPTGMFREYVEQVSTAIKLAVDAGVRVRGSGPLGPHPPLRD